LLVGEFSRRALLRWRGAGAAAALGSLKALESGEEMVPFSDYTAGFGVEAQAANPRVKCFDLRRLGSWVTPAGEFFAFHQGATVRTTAKGWRLRVGGCIERPAEFSLEDLERRPGRRDVAATLECAGNSGNHTIMNGLVSNAVWTGVGLAEILKECGVRAEAREVVFLGLDTEKERKWQAGDAEVRSPHGRSIFVQDALSADPMLAFAMNGRPLPAEHGFPLRLVLPGWYGMAQVKWLSRIEVIDRRYEGRHMARNYHGLRALQTPEGAVWLDTSISKSSLKSVIARVTRRLVGGSFKYRVAGAAWGGPARIEQVEVRIDDGAWRRAVIGQRGGDAAWLLWSYDWDDAAPGPHILVSRAVNAAGEIQPTADELRKKLASNREDNSQWPRPIVIAGPA
jgi:DMSO/TMAO reductase YedYZ molybdopterin-dependent catalytic subunit